MDKAQCITDDTVKELLLEQNSYEYFLNVKNRVTSIRSQPSPNDIINADLQNEINLVTRNRKFVIGALNRNSKVAIQIMGENNLHNTIKISDVTADIFQKGIKVVPFIEEEAEEKRKKQIIEILSFIFFMTLSYPIYRYSDTVLIAVIAMVINVFLSYYISLLTYNAVLWSKKEFFS